MLFIPLLFQWRFLSLFPSARVVGVDIVPEFVKLATDVSEAHVADAHDLPFKDKEFDWIFNSQTIEHCYDVPRAIRESLRVARVGAAFSLPLETIREYEINPSHYAYLHSTFDWLRLLNVKGWEMLYSVLLGTEFVVVLLNSELVYNDESGRLLHAS